MNGIPPDRRIMGRWAEERHFSINEVIVEKVAVVIDDEDDEENEERMRIS